MQTRLLVFEDIGEALTLQGAAAKGARHVQEEDLSIIKDAVMICVDGRIAWIGPRSAFSTDILRPFGAGEVSHSLRGATIVPGFVDAHTHLVFAGERAQEFEWRQQGQTYQEISAKGGGILSTVRETRKASPDELLTLAQARADRFVAQGVTTLEVKSGYGLDLDTEVKCLKVARQIRGPRVVSTYLGAHSRSPDHKTLDDYITFIVKSVLPHVKAEDLADRVDIYIENGFYTLAQAKAYFSAARALGFAITAHVEQLSLFGGTEVALDFAPQSVDHVVFVNEVTIQRLAKSKTTAVLLPTSDFYLKMRYPPARQMIDAGVRVALSTDFNPGTSPTQDLSFAGLLARMEMRMSAAEVLTAYTLGGAHALGLEREVGSLSPGKACDFAVLNSSWRDLFYTVGHSPVRAVYRSGSRLEGFVK